MADREEQLKQSFEQLQMCESALNHFKQLEQKLSRQLDFERQCREQDATHCKNEIKDLQDQLAEYEEETMQLQH